MVSKDKRWTINSLKPINVCDNLLGGPRTNLIVLKKILQSYKVWQNKSIVSISHSILTKIGGWREKKTKGNT